MIKKWENMTRDEIAALDKDKSIVLLPTSATEQHGAHLPVGTDAIILSTLVDKMVNECEFEAGNLIFAPQLNVGKSNEHMGFAGTITFGTQTYYSLLHDIATAICASGFKTVSYTHLDVYKRQEPAGYRKKSVRRHTEQWQHKRKPAPSLQHSQGSGPAGCQ